MTPDEGFLSRSHVPGKDPKDTKGARLRMEYARLQASLWVGFALVAVGLNISVLVMEIVSAIFVQLAIGALVEFAPTGTEIRAGELLAEADGGGMKETARSVFSNDSGIFPAPFTPFG